MTMEHGPVRLGTAGVMMPLYHSLIPLSLGNSDDVHPVALFEDIDFDGLSYRHLPELLKLSEYTGGWSVRFLQMAQFGLGQLAFFHLTKRQLDGFIPITLFCLDRDHAARACFDDGHRRKPRLIKYLSHPQLFTQQPVR